MRLRSPLVLFYAFAVGVSFAATFVTLTYIAWRYQTVDTDKKPALSQSVLDVIIRLGYGLANVANVWLGNTFLTAAAAGSVYGILFVLLSYRLDLPKKLFRFKKKYEGYLFCIGTPLLLAAIFVTIIRGLNTRFIFW